MAMQSVCTPVRQDHRPEFDLPVVHEAVQSHEVLHVGAKASHRALLGSNDHRVLPAQLAHQLNVQGLAEAHVRHSGTDANLQGKHMNNELGTGPTPWQCSMGASLHPLQGDT